MVAPGGVRQGDIYWVDFGEPPGSQAGYARPTIVIQRDLFNQSGLHTTVVCPLTSNLSRAGSPGTLFLRERDTHLQRDSLAVGTLVTAVDLSQLTEFVGRLPRPLLRELVSAVGTVIRVNGSGPIGM